MPQTFYDVLDVPSDAATDRITDAYRERVKETHPDVNDDPDAEAQFRKVQRAKEVLTDADERARYDRLGHDQFVSATDAIDQAWAASRTDASDSDAAATSRSGADSSAETAGERDRSGRRSGGAGPNRQGSHGDTAASGTASASHGTAAGGATA
jgi:DnaJ-class molecular chaperone